MLSTFVNLLISCKVLPTKAYRSIFFHDETFRLQTYILMSWIKIDFFGMRLRSWSFRFFCVTSFLLPYLSMHCEFLLQEFYKPRWISTLNQKKSFCDYLVDHNPIWVWIIILTESKESRAPYKEKFCETRLPGDSRGSTKKKVNLRYLP